jgi:hypothetical protein
VVTDPGAPVHYDVTRIALIDAIGNLSLGKHLTLDARGRFADSLLAQMPEASEPEGPVARLRQIADREIGGNAPWLADELNRLADRLAAEMRGECQLDGAEQS